MRNKTSLVSIVFLIGFPNLAYDNDYVKPFPGNMPINLDGVVHECHIPVHYRDHVYHASSESGLDPCLIAAIAKVESNWDERAVSSKGAEGLMQIMPLHGLDNPFDPLENLLYGATYFSDLLFRFNDDMVLALSGYNSGPNRVYRLYKRGSMERLPRETYDFVDRVMMEYRGTGLPFDPLL